MWKKILVIFEFVPLLNEIAYKYIGRVSTNLFTVTIIGDAFTINRYKTAYSIPTVVRLTCYRAYFIKWYLRRKNKMAVGRKKMKTKDLRDDKK